MDSRDTPAYNFPSKQIHICSQIYDSLIPDKPGKVPGKVDVRLNWAGALDEVGDSGRGLAVIFLFSPSGHPFVRLDTVQLHHPSGSFLAD